MSGIILRWRAALFAAGVAVSIAGPAAAAGDNGASAWSDTDFVGVRLLAAAYGVGSSGRQRLGLQFKVGPGWKIYWRSPGDAGIPPLFDWSRSRNVASVEVNWPLPKRFSLYGLETFGYQDALVLPIVVRLAQPGAAANVALDLRFAACSDICVPFESSLELALPTGFERPTAFATLIARYAATVPVRAPRDDFTIESVAVDGQGRAKTLQIVARSAAGFQAPDLIVEAEGRFLFGRPAVEIDADGGRARFTIDVDTGRRAKPLSGVELTLTLIDGGRAVELVRRAEPGT